MSGASYDNAPPWVRDEPSLDTLCADLWRRARGDHPQKPSDRALLLLAYTLARIERDRQAEAE